MDVGLYPSNSSIHFLVTVKPWEWGAGVDCSAGIMAYIHPVGPATAEAPKSEGNGHCGSEMPRQHAKMLDTLKRVLGGRHLEYSVKCCGFTHQNGLNSVFTNSQVKV